eukprot:6146894-Pleurochrysis_carterae.AAC.1
MLTPVRRLQKSPLWRATLRWTAQIPPTLLAKLPMKSPAQPLTPPTRIYTRCCRGNQHHQPG